MCIICVELISNRIRSYEARLAYVELKGTMPPKHQEEVDQLIRMKEWEEEKNRPAPIPTKE